MVTLSVEINKQQDSALKEVLDRNPGWNKALTVRALLAYFLELTPAKQEELVKKYRVIRKTE